MWTRKALLLPAFALTGWLFAAAALAADRCSPLAELAAGTAIEFRAGDSDASMRLEARLSQDLVLTLPVGSASDGVLATDSLAVRGIPLGLAPLEGVVLRLDGGSGALVAHVGTQRLLIANDKGIPQDVDKNPLMLVPDPVEANSFSILKGARLTVTEGTKVRVSAGTLLRWSPEPGAPLKARLARGQRFNTSATAQEAPTFTLGPTRQAGGGKLTLKLSTRQLDLSKSKPTFCLVGPAGDRPARVLDARFLQQQGDVASYELTVPEPGELTALDLQRDLLTRPARVRALVYSPEGLVVLDTHAELALSDPRWAVGFATGMLVLVYLVFAWFMSTGNPLAMVRQLIVQPSTGRYSVSNLQILLWTLLVIFALSFSWWTTDGLMELRPDILQLLGIAGGASVLGRSVQSMGAPPVPAAPTGPSAKDLVATADGQGVDLLRMQMLGFTIFSLAYALISVLRSQGLPELPQSLFWLMGLGNAAYVAGKVPDALGSSASAAPAPPTSLTSFEAGLSASRIQAMQRVLNVATSGTIDASTRQAVVDYMQKNGLYPAGSISEPLLAKLGV
ncbi:hypothetical protein [Roseateles sp.]|uniref:hypothetical protein n=1 Tax=Roseateles sp. TaxID=1971397 RepID=UPI0039EA1081